jgi:hypothetical protein
MSDIKLATYRKYYALGQRAAMAKLANPNLPEPSFSAAAPNQDPVARSSASLVAPNKNRDYMPSGGLNLGVDKNNPPLSDSQMLSTLRNGVYTDPLTGESHYVPGQEPVSLPKPPGSRAEAVPQPTVGRMSVDTPYPTVGRVFVPTPYPTVPTAPRALPIEIPRPPMSPRRPLMPPR